MKVPRERERWGATLLLPPPPQGGGASEPDTLGRAPNQVPSAATSEAPPLGLRPRAGNPDGAECDVDVAPRTVMHVTRRLSHRRHTLLRH